MIISIIGKFSVCASKFSVKLLLIFRIDHFFSEGCDSKQDATRCVRLAELPPVLNLQLNRFIFDMQTGRKKKLNSFVQFPEVLNMSQYLREPTSDKNTYYLTGKYLLLYHN